MDTTPATLLPRSLEPLPDESLTGFVLRLSHRLDLRPSRIIDLTGLATTGSVQSARAPARLLFMLEPDVRARFARLARLSREEADRLTLRRWAAHYPPIADAIGRPGERARFRFLNREWVLPTSTRYCPQCLAGDGSDIQRQHGGPWKLQWRLSVVFACLEHNRLLADVCPGCRFPALNGPLNGPHGLITGPGRPILHPAECRNGIASAPRGSAACGTRLDSAEIATASLTPEQAALQHRLLQLLSSDADPAESFHSFADLRAAAAVITATWPRAASRAKLLEEERHLAVRGLPSSSRRLPRKTGGRWGGAPLTSPAIACVLRLADGLVSLPKPGLRQAIGDLMRNAPDVHHSGWGRTWEIVRDDCSPSFRNELQQGVRRQFSPAVQQLVEAGGLVVPVRQRGYLPEHIPQRLPREWIEILLGNGAPLGLGGVLSRFRRIAAIQLVQAADGTNTTDASRFLGLPANLPKPGLALTPRPENPWTQMHVNERLPEAFEALALHIAGQSHPVDYHERRQRLAFWHLRQTDWESIAERLPPPRRTALRYGSELHRECASAYIWARVTSGEWRFAPIFRAPLAPAGFNLDPASVQHALLRLIDTRRDRYYTALRQALNDHARTLTAPARPDELSPAIVSPRDWLPVIHRGG